MNNQTFIGIDGCRSGWCVAQLQNNQLRLFTIKTIDEIASEIGNETMVFIDMPIGLTDAPEGRICELEAKQSMPSQYRSSIFLCPCKSAVYATDYAEANSIQRTITGKGLSIQAWNITKKIRELDDAVKSGVIPQKQFFESHPEMCFSVLNNSYPIHKKKTAEGFNERLGIISKYISGSSVIEQFLTDTKRKDVAKDDVLDAVCLAISARLSHEHGQIIYPSQDQSSDKGFLMKIVVPFVMAK